MNSIHKLSWTMWTITLTIIAYIPLLIPTLFFIITKLENSSYFLRMPFEELMSKDCALDETLVVYLNFLLIMYLV